MFQYGVFWMNRVLQCWQSQTSVIALFKLLPNSITSKCSPKTSCRTLPIINQIQTKRTDTKAAEIKTGPPKLFIGPFDKCSLIDQDRCQKGIYSKTALSPFSISFLINADSAWLPFLVQRVISATYLNFC